MDMKLFVIGATGKTGREILELARTRGHDVTAFVQSPEKLEHAGVQHAGVPGSLAIVAEVVGLARGVEVASWCEGSITERTGQS